MAALLMNTGAVSMPFPTTRTAARRRTSSSRCQASSSGGSSNEGGGESYRGRSGRGGSTTWVKEYDLYGLLGVERSSPQSEIKAAYRSLQKRCHPDVAGAKGHDMAIVLNEVYSLLSDPAARLAYDQEQAKQSEFVGYTGKPLYSAWFGGEAEQRAVFVDEVRCVGCLKCALYANKTFAVESVYGRARVVAQWADAEDKILDAIQTCPVDCISMVERSDLAALEFLMSKQPRGRVRVSEGNTVGARAPDIFNEVSKFQKRFQEMKQKSATRESEESEAARQSRSSAVQTIRSISNWWYWQPFRAPATTVLASLHLPAPPPSPSMPADPVTDRLQEAAARRKAGGATAARTVASYARRDDYWTPQLNLPSLASPPERPHRRQSASPPRSQTRRATPTGDGGVTLGSIDLTAPLLMAIISAGFVGYNREEVAGVGGGGIQEHVGGAAALGLVNSFELKIVLASVTWFIIGAAIAGFIQFLARSEVNFRK
uniref:J domain-containing protein n=1 Tax=Oryza glumipatula TaxID=40148 RepID=A0A0D9ZSE4_9ORYZ